MVLGITDISLMFIMAAVMVLLFASFFIAFRNVRQKQTANELLRQEKEETERQKLIIEKTLAELKATQTQLIQSAKMASLGELTAGIAHEIQNPLNFVNNFSDLSVDLLDELKQTTTNELTGPSKAQADHVIHDLTDNLRKIAFHGKRADSIVKGMLLHSRASAGQKQPTDINALADEYLRLSYHGLRAKDKTFNANFTTDFDETIGKVEVVPQDIGRVFLNLYNNAFYSVNEKRKRANSDYEPLVSVTTKNAGNKIELCVTDNGMGIPQNMVDKVFQPFFTTKSPGEGTGLGLSLSYDIIKAHEGELKVETKENEFAKFIIQLPQQN